ncbi:MAG: N-acetylmuramoyl-L-alanine amidase [Firmicutes bacterium]|nr:N-acetylmuramoyl-L-alanine amidase [Bacillota bacterium]
MRLKRTKILFFSFLIVAAAYKNYMDCKTAMSMLPLGHKTVVIDVGHGGFDPGKTGSTGKNEKDINLAIALKLQSHLEQSGATVIISRVSDEALGNSKRDDMRQRKEIANSADGDILLSIHQNSFTSPNAKGAQVFYYSGSEEGEALASEIQNSLKTYADPNNSRQIKANNDYYILKKPKMAAALVECGFLSNPNEEALLNSEEYQEKIAWALYIGISNYLTGNHQKYS